VKYGTNQSSFAESHFSKGPFSFFMRERRISEMTINGGKRVLAIFGGALLTGAVVMAQAGQPGMGGAQQNPAPGQQPQPGQNPNSGYPGGYPGANPGATQGPMSQSYEDQAFVTKTLSNSSAEAQMSQLATQKSPSPDVKKYGQNMVQIHSQLAQQLQPVAQMLGVKADQKPSKKDKKQIEQLKTLNGSAFDQAYLKAMANDQKRDVKSFKDEEVAAQNPTVKKAAQVDEPVMSQHLQALEQLAQNHNVTIASK
jgi:putative membrane protein